MERHTVPAAGGLAVRVAAGQHFRIVTPHGRQAADFFAGGGGLRADFGLANSIGRIAVTTSANGWRRCTPGWPTVRSSHGPAKVS